MDFRAFAKRLLLADRKITADESRLLRRAIVEDRKIDREEVEFLLELRREADAVDPDFDALLFQFLKKLILAKGVVCDPDAQWLRTIIFADNTASSEEVAFVDDLRATVGAATGEFAKLCEDCEQFRPVAVKKPRPPRPRGIMRKPFAAPSPVPRVGDPVDPREVIGPAVTSVLGIVLLSVWAMKNGRTTALPMVGVIAAITAIISTICTIVGLFVAAHILGYNYGALKSAVIKIASIQLLSMGIAVLFADFGIPLVGGFVLLLVTWSLFSWMFELDFVETFFSLLVVGFVSAWFGKVFSLVSGWFSVV